MRHQSRLYALYVMNTAIASKIASSNMNTDEGMPAALLLIPARREHTQQAQHQSEPSPSA